MIGQWNLTALDCEDPRALAAFYRELTGLPVYDDDDRWVELGVKDVYPHLAFQRVERHVPPEWPAPENGQQSHLDIFVPDLDVAQALVLALGARLVDGDHRVYRIYLDPAGHPFCLVNQR